MPLLSNRREFLDSAGRWLGGGWVLAHLPAVTALAACARDAALTGQPFQHLTPREAAAIRAFASRIVPSDDEFPGAEEAGAVYFVDAAIGGPAAALAPPIRAAAAELDARARQRGAASFAELGEEQRDEVIREIQPTPLFAPARMLVLMGVLADPVHGGNRNGAASDLVGIEHASVWQPPFGHYDAAAHGRDATGAAG